MNDPLCDFKRKLIIILSGFYRIIEFDILKNNQNNHKNLKTPKNNTNLHQLILTKWKIESLNKIKK